MTVQAVCRYFSKIDLRKGLPADTYEGGGCPKDCHHQAVQAHQVHRPPLWPMQHRKHIAESDGQNRVQAVLVFVNLDDIIFSSTTAEQCSHLLQLFLILRKFDMVIK